MHFATATAVVTRVMEVVNQDWEDWDNSAPKFLAAWPFMEAALALQDVWAVSGVIH